MNSSQNDGGNNLRDAISNKKIMSYKLMSKAPGDRGSSEVVFMHNNILADSKNETVQDIETANPNPPIESEKIEKHPTRHDSQSMPSPNSSTTYLAV